MYTAPSIIDAVRKPDYVGISDLSSEPWLACPTYIKNNGHNKLYVGFTLSLQKIRRSIVTSLPSDYSDVQPKNYDPEFISAISNRMQVPDTIPVLNGDDTGTIFILCLTL